MGKTTLIQKMLKGSLTCLEADDITNPSDKIQRSEAISKVIEKVEENLKASPVVLLSWVFAKPELFVPFREHFNPIANVYQVYLVATEAAISKRLASRKEETLLDYSLDKLKLITALPFTKVDSTEKGIAEIGEEILQFIDGLPNK